MTFGPIPPGVEQVDANQKAKGEKPNGEARADDERPRVLTAAEFVAGFKPPSYLLDGIIQAGRLIRSPGSPATARRLSGSRSLFITPSSDTALAPCSPWPSALPRSRERRRRPRSSDLPGITDGAQYRHPRYAFR